MKISAKPKMPMASTTKSMPSCSMCRPRVSRSRPVSMSAPTQNRRMPTTIIATAFRIDPCASTTASTRPMIIRLKYSAGPNSRPIRVIGTPSAAMTTVAMVPATNEPMAARPRARPA